jgi:hypothetical protein
MRGFFSLLVNAGRSYHGRGWWWHWRNSGVARRRRCGAGVTPGSKRTAFVILRPVQLQRLAKLLDLSQSDRTVEERKRFADELVTF